MKPAVVVDVGNSLIKWGRCAAGGVVEKVALAHDEPDSWEKQLAAWPLTGTSDWAVGGVRPQGRDELVKWLRRRGDRVAVIEAAAQLPLQVLLDRPDHVGIDRLFDAVAANAERQSEAPAIVIDAGSAVTVDWVDTQGAFRGGSIFPGVRLMAKALHDYTALLPLIDVTDSAPLPGRSTPAAMNAGIFWAVAGGIRTLVQQLVTQAEPALDAAHHVDVFLTGGDTALLASTLQRLLTPHPAWRFLPRPNMTLEGIRLTAESLP